MKKTDSLNLHESILWLSLITSIGVSLYLDRTAGGTLILVGCVWIWMVLARYHDREMANGKSSWYRIIRKLYRPTKLAYSYPFSLLVFVNFSILGLVLGSVTLIEEYTKETLGANPLKFYEWFLALALMLLVYGFVAAYLFSLIIWGGAAIRLLPEGIAPFNRRKPLIVEWRKVGTFKVRRWWKLLFVSILDSEERVVVSIVLSRVVYSDFCRQSLVLAPGDSQIANFLKDETNRMDKSEL